MNPNFFYDCWFREYLPPFRKCFYEGKKVLIEYGATERRHVRRPHTAWIYLLLAKVYLSSTASHPSSWSLPQSFHSSRSFNRSKIAKFPCDMQNSALFAPLACPNKVQVYAPDPHFCVCCATFNWSSIVCFINIGPLWTYITHLFPLVATAKEELGWVPSWARELFSVYLSMSSIFLRQNSVQLLNHVCQTLPITLER